MKIQILLLYYDRPEMVKNALTSVKNQHYTDWHLSFIDDGSKHSGKTVVDDVLADSLEQITYYNTGDSIETKRVHGSRIGEYMNTAIQYCKADIAIMLCDDDALLPDYLSNLNRWFTEHPDKQYCYSHVILYDPFIEKPGFFEKDTIDWMGHPQNRHRNRYNKRKRLNPANSLDSSQVAWKTQCNLEDGIWFPSPQTANLDAVFYDKLNRQYGPVDFSGFIGQYKGYHRDNLCIKNDKYSKRDLYKIEDLSKDCFS